jgi:RND family efflux transporter MFP subunit
MRVTTQAILLAALFGASQTSFAGQQLICLIQPSDVAEIGTSVYGAISKIHVERGDTVKQGQPIAELRNDVEYAALNVAKAKAQADADVQAAQANLDFAKQNLTRAENLIEKKFIAEQELEHIKTEFEVAEKKLAQTREQRRIWKREMDLAQSQLSQRTLVSPINGIVAERYLSLGERVENNSVARVVSIDPLYVEVMVPAVHFGKIKPDMTATIMPELPNTPAREAKVILVDKLIDGASNTFRVRLNLPNTDQALPAGLRCKADLGLEAPQATTGSGTQIPSITSKQ